MYCREQGELSAIYQKMSGNFFRVVDISDISCYIHHSVPIKIQFSVTDEKDTDEIEVA